PPRGHLLGHHRQRRRSHRRRGGDQRLRWVAAGPITKRGPIRPMSAKTLRATAGPRAPHRSLVFKVGLGERVLDGLVPRVTEPRRPRRDRTGRSLLPPVLRERESSRG